jgi:hypothetical protein
MTRSTLPQTRFWMRVGALCAGSLAACSSSHMEQWTPDPEALAAQRAAQQERQARAAEQAQLDAAQARELEQAVLEIEGAPSDSAALDVEQLELVLAYHCGDCHAHRGPAEQWIDGLFFDRFQELIDLGKVIPGDSARSRLLLRAQNGEMPPASSGIRPVPASTLQRIADFIDALPAPPPPAAPQESELPWQEEARRRPNVPPIEAACFEFLGDWIRCEGAGDGPQVVDVPGRDLVRCLEACRERSDCVAVTDHTWLQLPNLGCSLYLSSCAAPSSGVWQEEDGGRQYRKLCASE